MRLIAYTACGILCSIRCLGEVAGGDILSKNSVLDFADGSVIKIIAPTTIRPIGSKVVIKPINITWKEFLNSTEWEGGVPNYLVYIKDNSRNFGFDFLQKIVFNKTVTIECKNFKGGIVQIEFEKGSRKPELSHQEKVR